jgi:hypothetical protein
MFQGFGIIFSLFVLFGVFYLQYYSYSDLPEKIVGKPYFRQQNPTSKEKALTGKAAVLGFLIFTIVFAGLLALTGKQWEVISLFVEIMVFIAVAATVLNFLFILIRRGMVGWNTDTLEVYDTGIRKANRWFAQEDINSIGGVKAGEALSGVAMQITGRPARTPFQIYTLRLKNKNTLLHVRKNQAREFEEAIRRLLEQKK